MGLVQTNNAFAHAEPLSAAQLAAFGNTLVVAPHQDDETLGCGGTIRMLVQMHVPVQVVFVSDGSMSHPNSKKYPTEKRIALRESEAVDALQILGVGQEHIHFLRLQDSQLPTSESMDFGAAVAAVSAVLTAFSPQTILLPWQRDPHPDHRATWQIVTKAISLVGHPIRRLEYFIWLWERAGQDDLPLHDEGLLWKVDIAKVRDLKKTAVAAHLSQTTQLIDDDPDGFTLSAEVLAHFDSDFEILFEKK